MPSEKLDEAVVECLEGAYCPVPGAPDGPPIRGIVVRPAEDIAAMERRVRAQEADTIKDRLPEYLRIGTPDQLFARVGHPRIAEQAKRWVPARGSLLLLGDTRLGKSAAMGYIFRRLLGRGVKLGEDAWRLAQGLAWLDATDIETADREHSLGKGKAPELVRASSASVLFVDDLGWDRDPKPLSLILHARYKRQLVTVAATSRPQAELNERYGGAALRRLFETGGRGVTVIDLTQSKGAA